MLTILRNHYTKGSARERLRLGGDQPFQDEDFSCLSGKEGHVIEYVRMHFDVRRGKAWIFSGCNSRPATGSLQPVAIGAAVEVTILPKPSMERVALGDSASKQAVT